MDCPVCKNVQLSMTERQGIEIDYCPSCRGVWLDRGELDKIIERSASPAAVQQPARPAAVPPPAPVHAPQPGYPPGHAAPHYPDPHYYYKKKRKGGFLEDLFDFD